MKKTGIAGVLVVMLAASTAASLAWGEREHEHEALALWKANISLSQAIDNALSAVPGQALSAELEDEQVQPVFVVEVVSKEQIYEVRIDSQSGKVMDKKVDAEDHEDHHHHHHDDRE